MSKSKKVTVLCGGFSAEREVSLASGAAAFDALKQAGYDVDMIDLSRDIPAFVSALKERKPDVVLNALHGQYGEDGCIQGLLDMMQIPYTHSGQTASAVAMDKVIAKKLYETVGIPVADSLVLTREELLAASFENDVMERPYVVKPIKEGSSVEVFVVEVGKPVPFTAGDLNKTDFMVEKYIPGREFTSTVMGDKSLGVTEIKPIKGEFYDYTAKYADGGSEHILPAPVDEDLYKEIMSLAVKAHQVLGCRGVSRTDFRYDGKGLYVLETNTQPGMTATSLAPESAAYAGISFPEFVSWLVENAIYD
ncbi:MAG: D-alanine--D-alanine ligase [Alphaproteobacteria bacterium]|nr:D-alanine--D-alanine ligase [Alphaproteobacteria bacterium]